MTAPRYPISPSPTPPEAGQVQGEMTGAGSSGPSWRPPGSRAPGTRSVKPMSAARQPPTTSTARGPPPQPQRRQRRCRRRTPSTPLTMSSRAAPWGTRACMSEFHSTVPYMTMAQQNATSRPATPRVRGHLQARDGHADQAPANPDWRSSCASPLLTSPGRRHRSKGRIHHMTLISLD